MFKAFDQSFSEKFWQTTGKIRGFVKNLEESYINFLKCVFDKLESCLSGDSVKKGQVVQMVENRFLKVFNGESKEALWVIFFGKLFKFLLFIYFFANWKKSKLIK
jgi:hypothetical protein